MSSPEPLLCGASSPTGTRPPWHTWHAHSASPLLTYLLQSRHVSLCRPADSSAHVASDRNACQRTPFSSPLPCCSCPPPCRVCPSVVSRRGLGPGGSPRKGLPRARSFNLNRAGSEPLLRASYALHGKDTKTSPSFPKGFASYLISKGLIFT